MCTIIFHGTMYSTVYMYMFMVSNKPRGALYLLERMVLMVGFVLWVRTVLDSWWVVQRHCTTLERVSVAPLAESHHDRPCLAAEVEATSSMVQQPLNIFLFNVYIIQILSTFEDCTKISPLQHRHHLPPLACIGL